MSTLIMNYFTDVEISLIVLAMIKKSSYDFLIRRALEEDLADTGDVTTRAIFSAARGPSGPGSTGGGPSQPASATPASSTPASAVLISKAEGILAGCPVFTCVFETLGPEAEVEFFFQDGDRLHTGDRVAEVTGDIRLILTGERTALNFLSYLSGIATSTASYTEAARAGGKAAVLDTRKTLPGYRALAKYAVALGGGRNHRMGLYDMVMIKDNHIDAAGSIAEAVGKIRNAYGQEYKVEVECRTLADVREALGLDVDIVMLDNMDFDTVTEAVAVRRELGKDDVLFEVSGNMDIEKTRQMSGTGVEYISVGSVTHSVRAFDFSLKVTGGRDGC